MKKIIIFILLLSCFGCATVPLNEAPVETFIRTGFIMKLDIRSNSVWVHDDQWHILSVSRKESFINIMSNFFEEERGYSRVTVYGGYSGRKLAKNGIMGIKFY